MFVLTKEKIEDAATKAALLGLKLSEIRVSPETLAAYNQAAFGEGSIVLSGGSEEMAKRVRENSVTLACHKSDDEAYDTDKVTMILIGYELLGA